MQIPKKLLHKHCKSSYLVTIDKHQKDTTIIKGENGKELILITPKTFDRNFRTKNVNECYVVAAYGDNTFQEGDKLRVNHWLFQNERGKFLNPLMEENGVYYYKVDDTTRDKVKNIYWAERDGKRILEKDIFIVEYLEYDKVTTLDLVGEFTGRRRDIFRIAELPESETDFKVGDYVMTTHSADYELDETKGKQAMIMKDRIIAKVDSPDWRIKEYRGFRDHYKDIKKG